MNFEKEKIKLSKFLLEIDPLNMKQYGDVNIYHKEASTIIKSNSSDISEIKDIFKQSYKLTYEDEQLDEIVIIIRDYLFKNEII